MRWKKKENGQIRTINIFLLIPRTIENETRWLERATIKQVYMHYVFTGEWFDVEWVKKEVTK